jgi:hypothetical protein
VGVVIVINLIDEIELSDGASDRYAPGAREATHG